MKVLICGNSHVGALKLGLDTLPPDSAAGFKIFPLGSAVIELIPFSARRGNEVTLTDPEYSSNLKQFTGLETIAAEYRWGLCMGTHTTRILRKDCWIDAEPSEICRPGFRPVTTGFLRTLIDEEQRNVFAFFEQLKASGIPFFVISAPPPRRNHQAFKRGVRMETALYIDRQAREVFKTKLDAESIDLVSPPAEAYDSEGFLKAELGAGRKPNGRIDPHHANQAYGAIMMKDIISYLGSVQPAA